MENVRVRNAPSPGSSANSCTSPRKEIRNACVRECVRARYPPAMGVAASRGQRDATSNLCVTTFWGLATKAVAAHQPSAQTQEPVAPHIQSAATHGKAANF